MSTNRLPITILCITCTLPPTQGRQIIREYFLFRYLFRDASDGALCIAFRLCKTCIIWRVMDPAATNTPPAPTLHQPSHTNNRLPITLVCITCILPLTQVTRRRTHTRYIPLTNSCLLQTSNTTAATATPVCCIAETPSDWPESLYHAPPRHQSTPRHNKAHKQTKAHPPPPRHQHQPLLLLLRSPRHQHQNICCHRCSRSVKHGR